MAQQQRSVPLVCLDGVDRAAIATGNNAAWLCPCGRALPLLGMSSSRSIPSEGFNVVCPDCGREYTVDAETTHRTTAVAVREISRASSPPQP